MLFQSKRFVILTMYFYMLPVDLEVPPTMRLRMLYQVL